MTELKVAKATSASERSHLWEIAVCVSESGGPGSGFSNGSSSCHYPITINSSLLSSFGLITIIRGAHENTGQLHNQLKVEN